MKKLIVVLCAFTLSSCSVLKCLIDEQAPPLTVIDQRFDSVQTNLSQIDNLNPSVAAFISEEIIKEVLANEINKTVRKEGYQNSNINILKFDSEYYLSDQTIYLKPRFTLEFIKERITLEASFDGAVGVHNLADGIYFRPALLDFDIDSIEFDGTWADSKEALSKLAIDVLKNFKDNLNGVLFKDPISMKLEWQQSFEHPFYIASPALEQSTFRRFEKGLMLVNEKGLRLLAQVTPDPQNNIPEVEIDISKLGQTRSFEEFNSLFEQYSQQYEAVWNAHFDKLTETDMSLLIMISKTSISEILEETLNVEANISENFDIPKTDFNSSIELESNRLDCQTLREPFRRSRYQRESCSWSCQSCVSACFPIIGCKEACTDEPVCLSSRAVCNTREEGKVLADNLVHEEARIRHQIEQEARVGACDVAREAADFMALAKFKGNSQGSGKANIDIKSVTVSSDLTSLSLSLDINVQADAKINLKIQPIDLGHAFFCIAPYAKTFDQRIRVGTGFKTNEISIVPISSEDTLKLNFDFESFSYEGSLSPPPIQTFISDPEFLAKCGAANTLIVTGVALAKVAEIFGSDEPDTVANLLGRFSGEYTPPSFEMIIESETISLGEELNLLASPTWSEKAIHLTSP
jgi:hypothetical protein